MGRRWHCSFSSSAHLDKFHLRTIAVPFDHFDKSRLEVCGCHMLALNSLQFIITSYLDDLDS
jgi:hypothetical protein